MQAIILQIVGLLIITTLIVLFYSKPNIESVETKTYAKLIGLNFLFLVVGISTYIVAKLIGNFNLINILQKTYMSILALLNLYSMFYCISIYDKEEKLSNLKKILSAITIISILLIIVLPLNVIFEGDLLDGEGLSYDVALWHTILSFTFFLIITLYLLIKKYSLKKISPYIILIILYLIGFLIRSCYKELIFEGFFYAYILFIMYNTIENPDVKTAKELAFQKKLAEESSRKTLSLIEDMSEELKSSVKDLELISNTKIDKNNIKELNNVLSSFQENSVKLNDKISSILDLAVVKSEPRIVTYKYETLDKISFDYAVVEHESQIEVMRFSGMWKDLGTWNTLTEAMDSHNVGEALFNENCSNVHVVNELNLPILCMGLKNVVVSASPDGILVSDKEQSSYIKPFVNTLDHRVMFAEKSWGSFRVLDVEKESLTIKVTLNPGHHMNYHSHEFRDEVWNVISGEGRIVIDDVIQNVKAGDTVKMKAGCKHTVLADTELQIIEVQFGKDINVCDKHKYNFSF